MSKGLTEAEFIMSLPTASHWNWKVAFYLYGAGTSAGLIFLELVLRGLDVIDERTALWGMWIGLALALASLAMLFDHLGPGARWGFIYVFKRPRTSWIARGAIIITVLVFLRIMVLIQSLPGFEGLPWSEGSVSGIFLRGAVLLFALAFMAYSGLVLSSWNSIPFWNTPLLPILYVAYSYLGGMAALPIIVRAIDGERGLEAVGTILWPALLSLLVINGLVLLLYLWGMSSATVPARESVRRLVRGQYHFGFWIGIVGIGLALPTVVVVMVIGGLATGSVTTALLVAACAAIQLGAFLLRDNFLRVGVYGYPL